MIHKSHLFQHRFKTKIAISHELEDLKNLGIMNHRKNINKSLNHISWENK